MEESGLCSNIISFDLDRKTDHINVKSVYLKEEQKGVLYMQRMEESGLCSSIIHFDPDR